MEEGDGCEETLFSLELLVESARVEPRLLPTPLPTSGPFRPAVALRLLDFPTLLVRAPHAAPGPLVPFGRGKSCLFRLRPDALRALLRRSPLYALLLALPPTPGPARLLGSSSVSLAAAAEELLLGAGPGGRRGQFPLRDLMGDLVGELGLSYRLCNLGSTLLRHLGQGEAPEEPHTGEEDQQQPPHKVGTHSFRGLALELIPEVEENQDSTPESCSLESLSSSLTEPLSSNPDFGEIARELEIESNIFCPPPMYYSHPTENLCSIPKSTAAVTVAAVKEPLPAEEITLPSVVPPVKEELSSVQEATPLTQTFGSPEQLRQTLSQLPLLNALLVELSLLNSQALQPCPSTVHPQLAWLYQNVEEGTKAPSSSTKPACREDKKTTHRKERGRSPSPKLKRNRSDHLKCFAPSMQVISPRKVLTRTAFSERNGTEKNNTKENSPPRRRLTYGLTNTLRLRLQRSNPGMLKVHEKRELRRKKQGDIVVEKKGKSSSAKGKLSRGSPEHFPKSSGHFDEKSIPDRNAQINENVETLIQSGVAQDCPTTIKDVISDLQKKVAARAVKSDDNTKQKSSSEIIGSAYKEKSLNIHLPRVFLQDTDALENKTDTEVEKCIQHKDCDVSVIHNDSQSSNFESSYEFKNSDGVVASSENTAYSEDFTSADSSGTSLEAQESSPEPLLVNPDQSQSVMDSDSKMSEGSLTSESISPPLLPVPSAISHVQSLKQACDLKANETNTHIALNELEDYSLARTLKEEFAAQQEEKEGIKDIQVSKNKDVSSNMNCNIAKDQSSADKSYSLRTSQISSYLPSNVSDLDLSGLEESNTSGKEKEDDFEMADVTNQCRHVSELVVNKLPGYTM
ncbi:microtubule-associated protein 10 [Elgaria multicarinata webbii]|uniref:microtubule-associated protein 10 n=1 Tax=Elgaria multicarinata webbii TaxID=159646 RepID=UPI002FCD2E69